MALNVSVIFAAAGINALMLIGSPSIAEGTIAIYLLFLTTGIIALANNRAAMPIGESRRNVVFSLFVVAATCLSLACIELRAAIDPGPGPYLEVELVALIFVALSLITAQLQNLPFEKLTAADDDEIHVSPQVGRALLAEEAVAELAMLRRRERKAAKDVGAYVSPEKQLG
jgi:hypothetical protein